ncbi:MAG TPA: hypothetical protein DDW84_02330 [Phycisphaerales bacterium]|nr:MAG: hypothetical protein A2Y13_03755 [Planctomycetes bacterium GWC2_45_44]HBG77674.1 hypothetical protein [Phycisphaerales bacterium]HBR20465.1 hypothetical protein [Phycisphaerales bacterium]
MLPSQQLRYGSIASLIIGVSATIIAGFVERLGTIFDIAQSVLGLFSCPLLTCVFLAMFKAKTHQIIIIAIVSGLISGILVINSPLPSLLVAPATFVTSLFIALVVGKIFC